VHGVSQERIERPCPRSPRGSGINRGGLHLLSQQETPPAASRRLPGEENEQTHKRRSADVEERSQRRRGPSREPPPATTFGCGGAHIAGTFTKPAGRTPDLEKALRVVMGNERPADTFNHASRFLHHEVTKSSSTGLRCGRRPGSQYASFPGAALAGSACLARGPARFVRVAERPAVEQPA